MADTEKTTRRKLLAASGAVAAVGLAGCVGGDDADDAAAADDGDDHVDDADDHADDHDDHDHDDGWEFDLLDRGEDEVTAYVHGDHWHDGPLEVHEGDTLSLGANIVDPDGHTVELDGEFELRVEYDEGAPEILEFDYHGDHVHLTGVEEGITDVVFHLWHDDHADYTTPPITVTVGEDDHDHGHLHVEEFDLLDRGEDEVTAYVHDDHWHGGPLEVHEGDTLSLGAYVEDDHGDEIVLGSDLELRAEHDEGAPEILEFDYHGDHVHLTGVEEGLTDVVFHLWHDDHADYTTPPVTVVVGEADHDHDEVETFEVIDRSEDEVTAYVDGDHWHGELPEVPADDNISLGAYVEDSHGDEIEIDGSHYELRVDLADGADEGVVSFDHHGDHVHIIGEDDGTTDVVFHLWHDDHADYTTPPITAVVGDADHDDGHDHDDDDGHGNDDGY